MSYASNGRLDALSRSLNPMQVRQAEGSKRGFGLEMAFTGWCLICKKQTTQKEKNNYLQEKNICDVIV